MNPLFSQVQSAGTAEYTDCISTEGSWYDSKQSEGEAPVMLELRGMQSNPLLPSLLGRLWPWVVAPDRVLSMGRIELNCVHMPNRIDWNESICIKIDMVLNGLCDIKPNQS